MISFHYKHTNGRGQRVAVEFNLPADSSLVEVMDAFEDFLHAMGYTPEGTVEIVDATDRAEEDNCVPEDEAYV